MKLMIVIMNIAERKKADMRGIATKLPDSAKQSKGFYDSKTNSSEMYKKISFAFYDVE